MVPFSPISSTHHAHRPRHYGYIVLLLIMMVLALIGWRKAHLLQAEMAGTQEERMDMEAQLSEAQKNLSEVQAALKTAQEQNTQLQTQLAAPQQAATQAHSVNGATVEPSAPQAAPEPQQQMMNRTSSRPHASSR